MKKLTQTLSYFRGFKLYNAINVFGFGLSLACVIFFAMYVHREITADFFHSKIDRIYAITQLPTAGYNKTVLAEIYQGSLKNGSQFSLDNLPEIDKSCLVINTQEEITFENEGAKIKAFAETLCVDSTFFDMFDYPIKVGNKETMLKSPKSAVIREGFANKVFKGSNPIGKILKFNNQDIEIVGIMKDPAEISMLRFDVIIGIYGVEFSNRKLGVNFLYLNSVDQEVIESLNSKLSQPKEYEYFTNDLKYAVVPFKGLYLAKKYNEGNKFYNGDLSNIRILTLAAIIVLIIGLFNFVNLSSVITLKRGKELGVKKIFGASKRTVFFQFYIENLITISLSTIIGYLFLELAIPLSHKYLSIDINHIWTFDISLLIIILLVLPLITSLIPYVKFRKSIPINTMKEVGTVVNGRSIRYIFVVAQNVMTILMLVAALYFIAQFRTMTNADLGFDTNNVLVFNPIAQNSNMSAFNSEARTESIEEMKNNIQYVENALNSSPYIISYCFGNPILMSEKEYWQFDFRAEGNESYRSFFMLESNEDYKDVYGLELIEGDFFEKFDCVAENRWKSGKLVVSESALKLLEINGNWRDKIIESQSPMWYGIGEEDDRKYTISGIIKDIRPDKLSSPAVPVIIYYNNPSLKGHLSIRYQPGKEKEIISLVETILQHTSGAELRYSTLKETLYSRYSTEKRTATTYTIFAIIAIFISSMGLFGLSYFDVQQRRREIALRKVNGATVGNILPLLLGKYLIILGISALIALPISYIAITQYTSSFIVRAPISWWIFALSVLITALVSMLTLGWQTYKAAKENPAVVIK